MNGEPEAPESPRFGAPERPAMRDLRVVLADDHEVVRSGLRAIVDACPGMMVVGEAGSGVEAIVRTRELRPDVVVMDLSMPKMDGATATERILEHAPEVKVIALTAHDDRAHLARLLQAGASGYVLKRGAADELVRAIRTVAAGGSYVDPTLAGQFLRRSTSAPPVEPGEGTDPLSDREEEVLREIAWGRSNKEIAERLGISTKTVETYKARITEKLGLRSRTEMVRYALRRGRLSEN
jgi:two-component system, NarL family, response regulator NreC